MTEYTDTTGDLWQIGEVNRLIRRVSPVREKLRDIEKAIDRLPVVDKAIVQAVARSINHLVVINGSNGQRALELFLIEQEATADDYDIPCKPRETKP